MVGNFRRAHDSLLRRCVPWHICAAAFWIVTIVCVPSWLTNDNQAGRVFGCLAPLIWPIAYAFSCLAVYALTLLKDHWVWSLWLPMHIAMTGYFYWRMARPLME